MRDEGMVACVWRRRGRGRRDPWLPRQRSEEVEEVGSPPLDDMAESLASSIRQVGSCWLTRWSQNAACVCKIYNPYHHNTINLHLRGAGIRETREGMSSRLLWRNLYWSSTRLSCQELTYHSHLVSSGDPPNHMSHLSASFPPVKHDSWWEFINLGWFLRYSHCLLSD